MKSAFFSGLLFLTGFGYCQVKPTDSFSIKQDAMYAMINNRNMAYVGKPYPVFSVSAGNKKYSNETLKGKTVFINFWFTACAPCIAEFDELNRLFDKYGKNKNFEYVSFTYENPKEIIRMKKKYHIHYPVFSISQSDCYRLNLNNAFPTSVILDAAGNIKYVYSGGQTNKTLISQHFKETIIPLLSRELQL